MFTQTLTTAITRRVLSSDLVALLTGPHGVDRYTELLEPTWTAGDARAKVVGVRRGTARSVTLTLAPNAAFATLPVLKAGQYLTLAVEIDGRRHTRCYSPANAEGSRLIELTISRHDSGLVSRHLYDHAHIGMVLGIDSVGGEFVLPGRPKGRLLFISGGSGITPVMAMLRTFALRGPDVEVAVVHYARNAADVSYRAELEALPFPVHYSYTRSESGDLKGHFGPDHLAAVLPEPDAVFVCGPTALVDAVREHCTTVYSETFQPPVFDLPESPSGGRITFSQSGVEVEDDGRSLLDQAEKAGLNPESGCRMGICHTCTRRKTSGVVRNLTTGAVSTAPEEDVQICVSVPVGDVEVAL